MVSEKESGKQKYTRWLQPGGVLCNHVLSVSGLVHSHKCQLKVNFVVY